MLCTQYKFFIFSSFDSCNTELNSLKFFIPTNIELLAYYSTLLPVLLANYGMFSIPISYKIIKPRILVTFAAIASAKQLYRRLWVGPIYEEFPRQERSASENDCSKCCSFGKLVGLRLQNTSSKSPSQANADLLTCKGCLPASSVFSLLFPFFNIVFFYLNCSQTFSKTLFQGPTFSCCASELNNVL
jgi:hypothetical protein